MKEHPDIVVEPVEWEWSAETFATQLAGEHAADDVPGAVHRHQGPRRAPADRRRHRVRRGPAVRAEFNPSVLEAAKGTDGKIYGLPTDVYGVGLHYNRALFEEAGLDPDSPPTTWDEVRADAKAIADNTGQAGYVQMTTNNTGGWMLTTLTYALGGRMQSEDGTESTVDNDATGGGLQMLHDMRWDDDSMGKNTNFEWGTINEAFAAGKVGMYMSGSDVYNALVTTNQVDPDTYGLAVLPLGDSGDAGILGGGSVAAVSAKATPEEQEAAVAVERLLPGEARTTTRTRPWRTPRCSRRATSRSARRRCRSSTRRRGRECRTRIEPYVNVPRDQMTSFTDGVFEQALIPEPASHTQEVYAHPRLGRAEGAHRRERRHRRRC